MKREEHPKSWTRGDGIDRSWESGAEAAEKREELDSRHRRDSSIDRSRVGADAAAAEGGARVVAAGKSGEKLDSRR